MITQKNINALIALAIDNNKNGVIQSLSLSGYSVPSNISDADLFSFVRNIYVFGGIPELKSILDKVSFDSSKLTQQEIVNLATEFDKLPSDPGAKFSLSGIAQGFGDFLSGSSNVITGGGGTNISSLLSPLVLLIMVVVAIVLIIIFRKSAVIVIALVAIVLGVVLYGIFAKKVETVGSSTTTDSHDGALGWLKGILNGVHIGLV